jgi:hypothetical protein
MAVVLSESLNIYALSNRNGRTNQFRFLIERYIQDFTKTNCMLKKIVWN